MGEDVARPQRIEQRLDCRRHVGADMHHDRHEATDACRRHFRGPDRHVQGCSTPPAGRGGADPHLDAHDPGGMPPYRLGTAPTFSSRKSSASGVIPGGPAARMPACPMFTKARMRAVVRGATRLNRPAIVPAPAVPASTNVVVPDRRDQQMSIAPGGRVAIDVGVQVNPPRHHQRTADVAHDPCRGMVRPRADRRNLAAGKGNVAVEVKPSAGVQQMGVPKQQVVHHAAFRMDGQARLHQVAGGGMAIAQRDRLRHLAAAPRDRQWATRMEPAAVRRCKRVRHLAGEDDARARPARPVARHRRKQRLRIGMARRCEQPSRRRGFHDAAQIHHRDAVGNVAHHGKIVRDER